MSNLDSITTFFLMRSVIRNSNLVFELNEVHYCIRQCNDVQSCLASGGHLNEMLFTRVYPDLLSSNWLVKEMFG